MKKIFLSFAILIIFIRCGYASKLIIDPKTPLNTYVSLAEWNNDNALKKWRLNDIDNVSITNGAIAGITVKNCDAMVWNFSRNGLPEVNLDSANYKFIEFRFKRSPSKSELELFYGTSYEPGFSPLRMVSLKGSSLPQDGNFHIYRINMSNENAWKGFLRAFRVDPSSNVVDNFEIDYIRIGTIEIPFVNPVASQGIYSNKVLIEWTLPVNEKKYQVWRNATNSSNGFKAISKIITQNYFYDFSAKPDKFYYYKVKAVIKNKGGKLGAAAKGFATLSTGPSQPKNIFPANGTTITYVPVSLAASAYSDISNYPMKAVEWQIKNKNGMSWNSGVLLTNLTTIEPPVCFLDTQALWCVRYKNNRGKWSDWSKSTKFNLNIIRENEFTLWQLPSQSSSQMESYVIITKNGKVIVIDGGNTSDGPYLKNFLALNGNHVHYWFLSHPHKDHIDALTWILSNQGDLKIDKIFASFPPLKWIQKYEKGNVPTLEKFTAAMKKTKRNYIKLNSGDVFNIDGIKFEILSDVNLDVTVNAVNNSSIIMKVSDFTKSVLFLNDLGLRAGNKLLKIIPHLKLRSDYVQMAHHGQAGVGKNFYKVVQPKYCLWPTPSWLWDNDNGGGKGSGIWLTLETRKWMEELNVKSNYVSGLSFSPLKIFSAKNYNVQIPKMINIDPKEKLDKYISLAEWENNNNFDGWKVVYAKEEEVSSGSLSAKCDGDCQIEKTEEAGLPNVNLDMYKFIEFRFKRSAFDKSNIVIFYGTKDNPKITAERSINISGYGLPNDGKFHVCRVNVSGNKQWRGKLKAFRFDPSYNEKSTFKIDYIRLGSKQQNP